MRQPENHGQRVDDGLIYDVGAHLGEDTEFYLCLGYRVVAVEANPELAAKLRERFSEAVADGRLIIIETAVAEFAGTIDFFVSERSSVLGTSNRDLAARRERNDRLSRKISVAARPFGAILREFGIPYYLKVDIEGSDHLCLAALGEFAARPDFVSIEASVGDWRQLVSEFDALESLGYKRFQVVSQGRHPARTFVSRAGERLTFSFHGDASGPFGEDLQGVWLTRRQALRRYFRLWILERYFNCDAPLGRLFARFPILARIPLSVGWYDTHARR